MGHVVRMTATGALGITFVFLVDAVGLFWLAQLGEPRLVAAVGFAFAIQFFSVSIGVGLMIAATAVISRSIGQGQRTLARDQAGSAIVISVVMQSLVVLLIVIFRHDLVRYAGAEGDTAELAARYLAITMPSLVLMIVGMICSGALRADGFGAKAMYITLFSGLLLMVLDPVLIVWLDLRLDGAAYGLLLFRLCLLALGIYFAAIQQELIARPSLAVVRKLLPAFMVVAIPTIATQMSTPVGNYILTLVIAPYGDDAVAAWAVVGRLTVVVFGGIFALSGAIGGIFGQNFGAGQFDRVKETYRDALIFCLIYTLVAWALFIAALPVILDLFDLSGQGAEVLRAFAYVGVGGYVFFGALFVSNAAFNNLGHPARSTLLNWTKDGVFSWPLAAAFAIFFGAQGVIYGQAAAGMIVGTLAVVWGWYFVQSLRDMDTPSLDPASPRPYPNPDRHRRR